MAEQLWILSIFHYVVGGLHALFSCVFLFHVIFGLMMIFRPEAMGGFFLLCGWTLAVLTVVSGRFIALRKNRAFSLVVGGVNGMLVPLGTVLGVFDLILLMQEEARQLYAAKAAEGAVAAT